nr:class I SAM-dependent methyltransferase [Halobacillus sp. A5]
MIRPFENQKLASVRKDLINEAKGHVLEIGAGTGLNFPYYRNNSIVEAVEPNASMVNFAFKKGREAEPQIRFHEAKAESLPFPDDYFDSVAATLVFCTIPGPKAAIKEIERTAKPGSKVLLFEHVKMEEKCKAAVQEKVTPLWKRICDGCHLDRDTVQLIKESRIVIDQLESYYGGLFVKIVGHLPYEEKA